ncbi:TetR/AcrR family transcriptional regulator [Lentzea sp.]|uniref:TetR/AcrR family transcriptional regulator n=1 Tax=Lentzea sp. TaxID=56099 RepID=UPI002ED541F1
MTTRAETAAATRQALLRAAEELLDRGGVEAVTLREVGGAAGLSRSAAYRHFADKDAMLTAISFAGWEELTDRLHDIAARSVESPAAALREAIGEFLALARTRPGLYRLMLTRAPFGDMAAEVGERSQDVFHTLVARVVPAGAARPFAGLIMAAAHGIADLEAGGQLDPRKYDADGDALIDLLIATLPAR